MKLEYFVVKAALAILTALLIPLYIWPVYHGINLFMHTKNLGVLILMLGFAIFVGLAITLVTKAWVSFIRTCTL